MPILKQFCTYGSTQLHSINRCASPIYYMILRLYEHLFGTPHNYSQLKVFVYMHALFIFNPISALISSSHTLSCRSTWQWLNRFHKSSYRLNPLESNTSFLNPTKLFSSPYQRTQHLFPTIINAYFTLFKSYTLMNKIVILRDILFIPFWCSCGPGNWVHIYF